MGWFADPVILGDYPKRMRETVGREGERERGREGRRLPNVRVRRRSCATILTSISSSLSPSYLVRRSPPFLHCRREG